MLHRINDVCDSEAIAYQLLSRLAISINKENAALQAYNISRANPEKDSSTSSGDLSTRIVELDYALIAHAEPGEEIKAIQRDIPGKDFPQSVRMFLRLLGLPMGLPLELVLLDWTQSNYSQSRAVLQQAYERFLEWQDLIEEFFYREIFAWQLARWSGDLIRPKDAGQVVVEWIRPTFPWIDPTKEAQAWGIRVDRGFCSHQQVCKSVGLDRGEVVAIRTREITEAIETAKSISEKTGEKVPWQIFAGLEPPKTAAPAGSPDQDQDKDKDTDDDRDQQQDQSDDDK